MNNTNSILLVGRDFMLTTTRQMVLQHAGHLVTPVSHVADAERIMIDGVFWLVILCQTLTRGERERLITTAQAHHLDVYFLVLTYSGFESGVTSGTTLPSSEGPATLVAEVNKLISDRRSHGIRMV